MLDEVQTIAQQLNFGSLANELERGGSEMLAGQHAGVATSPFEPPGRDRPTSPRSADEGIGARQLDGVQRRPGHASGRHTAQGTGRPTA